MHFNIPNSQSTLVCDVEGALLKSSSTFPYFMLVAFEGGGFFRALVLLLLYPLICCLSQEVGIKIMVMISFSGLREEKFRVGRTVLPKYFLEGVGLEGFEVMRRGGRRVCVSSMPRVMVEEFLKDYLEVEVVLGRELKVFGGLYTGFMEEEEKGFLEVHGEPNEVCGEVSLFGSASCKSLWQNYSYCKNSYLVTEAEKQHWHPLPRCKYPKPLIFHDGRLAFHPTALATLAMFMWSPLGLLISILRVAAFLLLPYKLSVPVTAILGMTTRYTTNPDNTQLDSSTGKGAHNLYICNHSTLLDPLYISGILNRKISAATYSLSRISEFLSPIKTFRLTRNKEEDKKRMKDYLSKEDLVVCPEGTTCREPYLLRFSPLFAELTDEIVPVAMVSTVSMFHGTTANGLKWLDPFYFLMNPNPTYEVNFLEKMSTTVGENGRSHEVANMVQRKLGRVLGFECTALTRKDKYLLLAGNEGLVDRRKSRR